MGKMKFNLLFFFLIAISVSIFAEGKEFKGKVVDNKNQPLPGVSISVKGTTVGVATDFNGEFSLKADEGKTLVVSFIGFTTRELVLSTETVLNVVLVEDTKNLEEVVVVGYGTQKKTVVTGAIASVKAKELESMNVPRVEDALKGRTAGVTVAQNSGAPGASSKVIIRGITSINNNDPLYVVDGIPITGGLDQINKSDVESLEVLKDAASCAIYGTAAACGVVLITTKKGKVGDLKVTLNSSYGIQAPETKLNLLNAREYAYIRNESRLAVGLSPLFSDPNSLGSGTDWQSEVFNYSAPIQNHELSISGGNEKSTFFASFGYFDQIGVVASDISSYQRYTGRLNTDHKIKKWLKVGNTLTYSHTKSKSGLSENNYYGQVLSSAISLDPVTSTIISDKNANVPNKYAVKNNDRYYYGLSQYVGQEMINPLAFIHVNQDNYYWADNVSGNVYLQLEPIENLVVRSSLGAKFSYWGGENYVPLYYYSSTQMNTGNNYYSRARSNNLEWVFTNTAQYTKKLFKDHNFSALIGTEVRQRSESGISISYNGIAATSLSTASMNESINPLNISAWGYENQPYRLLSYFARLNYDYKDTYIFTGIVRRDGSSRFGSNNKFGNFPSASVRWNAHNEKFWIRNDYVESFDMRLGYGINGSDKFDDFKYTSLIKNYGGIITGTDDLAHLGFAPSAPANPDLKWEKTTQINFGIDMMFLNNFNLTLDLFKKKTDDMLMQVKLPGYVGAAENTWANVAYLETNGIEFNLTYNKDIIKDLNVSVTANFAYNTTEVKDIGENEYISLATMASSNYEVERMMEGKPYGMYWGFRTNGIFQTQEEVNNYKGANGKVLQPNANPGDFKWRDLNGDGKITANDRENLGLAIAPFTFGLTLKTTYKDFDFTIFGQGVTGNKICNQIRRLDVTGVNWTTEALGRWTGEGTSNSNPRILEGSDPNGNFANMSDFYLEDGSYFKIKTLQIGYTVPKNIIKKLYLEKFRVYVTGNNLYTFTKYTGFSPEIGGDQGIYGIDRGVYPQARSYMFGIDLSF